MLAMEQQNVAGLQNHRKGGPEQLVPRNTPSGHVLEPTAVDRRKKTQPVSLGYRSDRRPHVDGIVWTVEPAVAVRSVSRDFAFASVLRESGELAAVLPCQVVGEVEADVGLALDVEALLVSPLGWERCALPAAELLGL